MDRITDFAAASRRELLSSVAAGVGTIGATGKVAARDDIDVNIYQSTSLTNTLDSIYSNKFMSAENGSNWIKSVINNIPGKEANVNIVSEPINMTTYSSKEDHFSEWENKAARRSDTAKHSNILLEETKNGISGGLANQGGSVATVWNAVDISRQRNEYARAYTAQAPFTGAPTALVHEFGHCLGLEHGDGIIKNAEEGDRFDNIAPKTAFHSPMIGLYAFYKPLPFSPNHRQSWPDTTGYYTALSGYFSANEINNMNI